MKVINGLLFDDGKILIVKKKGVCILPGGKIEAGESEEDCLKREFSEELSGTKIKIGEYYGSFSGITPHSEKYFETEVYHCELEGDLGEASSEISYSKYVGNGDFCKYTFSEVTGRILGKLALEGLVK